MAILGAGCRTFESGGHDSYNPLFYKGLFSWIDNVALLCKKLFFSPTVKLGLNPAKPVKFSKILQKSYFFDKIPVFKSF